MSSIEEIIDSILPKVVELRHRLHAHPETAFEEYETAKTLLDWLEKLEGFEIQSEMASTGIVATLGADKSGPCVALRADMDALPMQEHNDFAHASTRNGFMHACGHDGHMACLAGAAEVLSRSQDSLAGPVKLIFQPAEELGSGAAKMIEQGALQNPEVKAVFGLHGWPYLEFGKIGFCAGAFLASSDMIEIEIEGKGCHAAMPHKGVDPVLIASHIILGLQSISSRETSPLDSVVVSICEVEAGSAHNIIPQMVKLRGTVRSLDSNVRDRTLERIEQIAASTAEAHEGKAELHVIPSTPVLVNDKQATDYLEECAQSLDLPHVGMSPVMGGEDFAYYSQKVPSSFWVLGMCPEEKPLDQVPGLHHPNFDFNDNALKIGIWMHAQTALKFADSGWDNKDPATEVSFLSMKHQ